MKDDVKAAFKVFDHNNDGSISRSKLLLIIVEIDESDEDDESHFDMFNHNNDGKIIIIITN